MNHRSTLAPEGRNRSGHRYRYEDQPAGGHAAEGRAPAALNPFGTRSAAPAAGYNSHNDEYFARDQRDPAFDTNDSWAQGNSWSDGAAWDAGDSWSAEEAWSPEQQWSAEEPAWSPEEPAQQWSEERAQWSEEPAQQWSEEPAQWSEKPAQWPAEEAWGAEEAAESEDHWDAWDDAPEKPKPARPTIIPARLAGRRGGAHRVPAPPASLKGRAAVAAVAAGAVVAAGQAALASPEEPSHSTIDYQADGQVHEIAAQSVSVLDPSAASPNSPQVLNVSAPGDLGQFGDMLDKGVKYAQDLAAQEAAKLRPLFTKFAAGNFTSGYGARWGVQHLGVDIAGPIGTPIVAVADGTVIEAGPAAGFGMWVRILHDDGTVTIYGHIDTATVSQGQRVMAGDQIATIGNRGFSTGPHVHFEVWLNGTDKIDPLPWLATRGISLGVQRD